MMKSKKEKIIFLIFISISFSLIINTGFSDTKYVEFRIYIDRTAPEYFNETISSDLINDSNDLINISVFWRDNDLLSHYFYESNITGVFENSTSKNFIEGYSNETIIINNASYEGETVYYKFYGFDRAKNMNQTEYKSFSILSQEPFFSNITQSHDVINEGENITLSAYWSDNFNVYESILQTNKTSEWTDESSIIHNSNLAWSNYTFNTSDYAGNSIAWRIKARDSVGNINTTTQLIFNVI